MVRGIEDLRTPLRTILDLDKKLRGTLSGFMMPAFVIDLPGGGGKRLVSTVEDYNEKTGVAIYTAPGLPGQKGKIQYTYYDPKPEKQHVAKELHQGQEQTLQRDTSSRDLVSPTTPQQGSSMTLLHPNQQSSFIQSPRLARKQTVTNVRPIPNDLASHHLGSSGWQHPPSATAP